MSFSIDSYRMYAALRCIESELEKPRPSMKRIREIMAEAGRELRPTTGAVDETICTCSHDVYENVVSPGNCMACGKPFRH